MPIQRTPAEQYRARERTRRENNSCVRNTAGDFVELLTGRRCGLGRKTRGKKGRERKKKGTRKKKKKRGTRKKKRRRRKKGTRKR